MTGAPATEEEYRAKEPRGRAFLHAAGLPPVAGGPSDEFPLLLTTGRTLAHFHTRTKTGRAPGAAGRRARRLGGAAPRDAERPGSPTAIASACARRAARSRARARSPAIRAGHVFVPFHYGYWDQRADAGRRAPPTS